MTAKRRNPPIFNGILQLVLDATIENTKRPPPPKPVARRECRDYRRELDKAREALGISRENLHELMTALPVPRHVGDRVDLEWLAWRDAILDRALALGYIVGHATDVIYHNDRDWWSVQAMGTIYSRIIQYPIGGYTHEIGRMPRVGQAVLMTRGYDSRGAQDRESRPYIPVSRWFLDDPVSAP